MEKVKHTTINLQTTTTRVFTDQSKKLQRWSAVMCFLFLLRYYWIWVQILSLSTVHEWWFNFRCLKNYFRSCTLRVKVEETATLYCHIVFRWILTSYSNSGTYSDPVIFGRSNTIFLLQMESWIHKQSNTPFLSSIGHTLWFCCCSLTRSCMNS